MKKKSYYKPSRQLLEDMLKLLSVKEIAELCDISETSVKKLSAYYKFKGRELYETRKKNTLPVPDFTERIAADKNGHKKFTLPNCGMGPDECEKVPKEIFKQPKKKKVKQKPNYNTHDIPGFINSGKILDWFYTKQEQPQQIGYGSYIGTANRRNSKGASDRNYHAVKLA